MIKIKNFIKLHTTLTNIFLIIILNAIYIYLSYNNTALAFIFKYLFEEKINNCIDIPEETQYRQCIYFFFAIYHNFTPLLKR